MSQQDNPIVISVPFHGDTITAIETPDGVMVAVKPICERLGIDWKSQHRKLASETRWGMVIMWIPSAGGMQETTCIPVSLLAAWLFTIHPNKVKLEVRKELEQYQAEAAQVLDRHFRLRAAETSARIAEMERMLWHAGQHLRMKFTKWNTAYLMLEMGQSDYLIAKRLGISATEWAQEKAAMQSCGLNPKWRQDMAVLQEQVSDLKWQLGRKSRQGDLFGGH